MSPICSPTKYHVYTPTYLHTLPSDVYNVEEHIECTQFATLRGSVFFVVVWNLRVTSGGSAGEPWSPPPTLFRLAPMWPTPIQTVNTWEVCGGEAFQVFLDLGLAPIPPRKTAGAATADDGKAILFEFHEQVV